jgi:hypothetical protein
VSADASELVSIPRAELDAIKAELKRLRREVGRGVAKRASRLIPARAMTPRPSLAEAWGMRE